MKCSLFTFHTRYQTLLSIKRRMLGSWIFFWEVKVGLVVRLITFFNNVYSYSRGASCYFLSKSCVRCVWYTVRWFWKTVTALPRLHPIRLMTASDQKYCYSISQCVRGAFRWLERLESFAETIKTYTSIDMQCCAREQAAANWDQFISWTGMHGACVPCIYACYTVLSLVLPPSSLHPKNPKKSALLVWD
jgi:hypothetical protein